MALHIQRLSLADQFLFYATGDLGFAECGIEERNAFAKRVKSEHEHAKVNGGKFRDGSSIPEVWGDLS